MIFEEAGRFTVILHRKIGTREIFVETIGESSAVWCKDSIRDAMFGLKRALNDQLTPMVPDESRLEDQAS
jgi:hypothetical protein